MRGLLFAIGVLMLMAVSCADSIDAQAEDSSDSLAQNPPDPAPVSTATPPPLPEDIVYIIDPNAGNLLSSIIILDGFTAETVKTYNVRHTPSIAFSRDGNSMFVADSYRTRVTRGDMNSYISSFDTRTGSLLADDVPLPDRTLYKFYPIGSPMFFTSDDGEVLYTSKYGEQNPGDIRLAEIDPDSLEVIREAPYPNCGWRVAANSDQWLCVNSSGRVDSGFIISVSIINPIDGIEIENLAVFQSNRVVAATKPTNSDKLFILSQPATVDTVDIRSGAVTRATLEHEAWLSLGPIQNMEATPDGTRLFVGFVRENEEHSGFVVSEIRAYDTTSWELLGILELDNPVMHFAISNDGQRLYAVSPFEQSIAIYNTSSLELTAFRSDLGRSPARVVIPPSTQP